MLFFDDVPGKVYAPNLTRGRGGVSTGYATEADWDRAVRHGIRPSGRAILPFMPWGTFSRMGDADMAALIAYLRQVPPVDNVLPATRLRPVGYLIAASAPIGTEPGPPPHNQETEPAPTAAYGAHLASHTCVECHGEALLGADRKGPPQGPSLQGAARWSLEEFTRAVREGRVPGGRQLSEEMPYRHFAHLTDVEVAALYQHLQTLPRS
jgi:cytochrome c553